MVFLLFAIGTTVWNQYRVETIETESVILANVEDREYPAEVFVPTPISREERLASMRQKIAEGGAITISSPEPVVEEETEESDLVTTDVVVPVVQRCSGYREFSGSWQFEGIKFDVTEGARIVYRESTSVPKSSSETIASGTVLVTETGREILLQLPIRTSPSTNTHCLASDVVGVAQDGSLIRNNETGLYGIFSANTLIGYALDGFPIYGVSNIPSDKCGGQMTNGQYGYYLAEERDVILNCYSSVPVSI